MVAPLIAMAAAGVIGGGLNALFGRRKPSFTEMTAIPLRLQRLSETLPPSPERDAIISSMSTIRQNLQTPFLDQANKIGGSIDAAEAKIDQYGNQSGNLGNLLIQQAGNDMVTPYFGNFGERQQDLNRTNQQILDASYSNTGTQGGQALGQINNTLASAASRGLVGSSMVRDDILRQKNTLANARAEQAGKLSLQGNQQMVNYGNLVNDANRTKLQGYQQAGNMFNQGADLAGKIPQLRINATQALGGELRGAAQLGAQQENIGTEQKIQREKDNVQINNDEALNNVQNQRQVQAYNNAGRDSQKNNRPSVFQAFTSGFGAAMPLGQALGSSAQANSYKPPGQSGYGSSSW